MWREIYFKLVRTANAKRYFINSSWTTEEFIDKMREKIRQDFDIDNCEFIDTENNLPDNIAAEDGPAIMPTHQTLLEKYEEKFFQMAIYIRPLHRDSYSVNIQRVNYNNEILNNPMCIICFSQERNIVFTPCNHLCVCSSCSMNNSIQSCPLCRINITDRMVVYL